MGWRCSFRVGALQASRGAVLLPSCATALSELVWWWMFEPLYSVVNWTLKSLHIIDHDIPRGGFLSPSLAMFTVIWSTSARPALLSIRCSPFVASRASYEAAQSDAPAPSRAFGTSPLRC